MENKYYAHGKFFDDQNDFIKFCCDWPELPFDIEEFTNQMDFRIGEAKLNNIVSDGKMTNRDAYKILRISTDWVNEK